MTRGKDIDKFLVDRILNHADRSAFDELYNSYSSRVYNFCLNFLGNEEDAKDCTQEVFIKVFCSIKSFKQKSSFYTWLYRIMVNKCKDYYRKRKYPSADIKQLEKLESEDRSVISKMVTEKAIRAFHDALGALSSDFRTVIILRDLDNRSYMEIADITGTRIGTVRSRIARARSQIAEKLKDYRDELQE